MMKFLEQHIHFVLYICSALQQGGSEMHMKCLRKMEGKEIKLKLWIH